MQNKIKLTEFYSNYGNCVVFTKREDMQKFLDASHTLGKFCYMPDTSFKMYDSKLGFTTVYQENMCLTSDEQYSMEDFYRGKGGYNIYKFSQIDFDISDIQVTLFKGLSNFLVGDELDLTLKYLLNNYDIRIK